MQVQAFLTEMASSSTCVVDAFTTNVGEKTISVTKTCSHNAVEIIEEVDQDRVIAS